MTKPVILSPDAENDLNEAFRWYENKFPGLGLEFLLCVDAVIESIERNPNIYPIVHRNIIRRSLTRRFPYEVFFVEGEETISVIAVFHAKRHPGILEDRV